MLPTDAPKVVEWRIAQPDEIPGGAAAVQRRALKAGWTVLVGYSRGPWMTASDDDEDADPADVKICEMVTVQGRKLGKRFRANWHRKLWTKDAEYKFAGGQTDPPAEGEVVASKAKKDRHPEHLGAKTVGGLKNSKTLNDYLKETTS